MKKFKRLLAIAISLAMCCGMLAACGGKGDDDKKGSGGQVVPVLRAERG